MDRDGNIHLNFMKKTKSFPELVHKVACSAAVISVRDQVKLFEEKNQIKRVEQSQLANWAVTRDNQVIGFPIPGVLNVPEALRKLPLKSKMVEMIKELRQNDVMMIEAPTGSGKSAFMPFIMLQLAKETKKYPRVFPMLKPNSSWKAVHVTPIGEQCIQNADFMSKFGMNCISFGSYTANIEDDLLKMGKNVSTNDHYVYCTGFFGLHCFDGTLHAFILDEIHDLTPNLIEILHRVKAILSLPSQKRTIFKVVLLSATLSQKMKEMIFKYFDFPGASIKYLKYDESPYENETINISDMTDNLLKNLKMYQHDDRLFQVEEFKGIPNSVVLRQRVNAVICAHIVDIEQDYFCNGNHLKSLPGVIAFYPGEQEVERGRQAMFESDVWKEQRYRNSLQKSYSVKCIKVSGKDRADIKFLKAPYKNDDPMRIAHSSTVLSSGVTLNGIGIVVDDCTVKMPQKYSHNGIHFLVVMWQDRNMILQKKGRAGRQGNGKYYPVVSKKRLELMMKEDHTLLRLDRLYRTNDICFILEHNGQLMIEPQPETMKELLIDMWNTGFLKAFKPQSIPTVFCKTISSCFSTTPLVLVDLFLRCMSYGVGLHGLVFVASCLEDHRAVRRGNPELIGRNDFIHPMNKWNHLTEAAAYLRDSEMEVITEMTLNLLMVGPLGKKMKEGKHGYHNVYIPDIESYGNKDGISNILKSMIMLFSNFNSVNNLKWDFFQVAANCLRTEYDHITVKNDRRHDYEFKIYRLSRSHLFRCALLQSLGSRVVFEAGPIGQAQSEGNCKIFYAGGISDCSSSKYIQGETILKTDLKIAVYYEVMSRNALDNRMTGLIHCTTQAEYVVFGNVVAASRDEVDMEHFILKIATNTSPVYVHCANEDTLMAVVCCRRIFSLLSTAVLLDHEKNEKFFKELMHFIGNIYKQEWAYEIHHSYTDNRPQNDSRFYRLDNVLDRFAVSQPVSSQSDISMRSIIIPGNYLGSHFSRSGLESAVHSMQSMSEESVVLTGKTQDSQSIRYNEFLADEPAQAVVKAETEAKVEVVDAVPFRIDHYLFYGDPNLDREKLAELSVSLEGFEILKKYWERLQQNGNGVCSNKQRVTKKKSEDDMMDKVAKKKEKKDDNDEDSWKDEEFLDL